MSLTSNNPDAIDVNSNQLQAVEADSSGNILQFIDCEGTNDGNSTGECYDVSDRSSGMSGVLKREGAYFRELSP